MRLSALAKGFPPAPGHLRPRGHHPVCGVGRSRTPTLIPKHTSSLESGNVPNEYVSVSLPNMASGHKLTLLMEDATLPRLAHSVSEGAPVTFCTNWGFTVIDPASTTS